MHKKNNYKTKEIFGHFTQFSLQHVILDIRLTCVGLIFFFYHQQLTLTNDTSKGCCPYQRQPPARIPYQEATCVTHVTHQCALRKKLRKTWYMHLFGSFPPATEINLLWSVSKFIEASFITLESISLLTGKWWHGGKMSWLSLRNRQSSRCEFPKQSPALHLLAMPHTKLEVFLFLFVA